MTDFIQLALGALPVLLPKRTVTYMRGTNSVVIEVTVGRTSVEYEDDHGVRIRSEIRDYLIVPSDLILNSVEIEPEEGDKVIDNNEGNTSTYVVMGTEYGQSWRWTDRYHTLMRVHAREMSEV